MKRIIIVILVSVVLVSCGKNDKKENTQNGKTALQIVNEKEIEKTLGYGYTNNGNDSYFSIGNGDTTIKYVVNRWVEIEYGNIFDIRVYGYKEGDNKIDNIKTTIDTIRVNSKSELIGIEDYHKIEIISKSKIDLWFYYNSEKLFSEYLFFDQYPYKQDTNFCYIKKGSINTITVSNKN